MMTLKMKSIRRKRWARQYPREYYTLAEATGLHMRDLRVRIGEPSFCQVVFEGASMSDNIHSCSLCGKSLSVCRNYDCMPHHLKLWERAERRRTYNQRRAKEKIEAEAWLKEFKVNHD